MKKPLVSVVIPAYNEENYIANCLKSVLAQDFPKKDYEVIVVNNNSTDNTANLVKKYFPQVKLITEKKQGVVFARIKGVAEAKGEIIAFTDADTLLPSDWLKKITHAFSHPQIVGVGGHIKLFPPTPLTHFIQFTANLSFSLFKTFPGSNMAFLKKAYLVCGGFSPKINIAEDVYLASKLKKIGRIKILPDNKILTSSRRSNLFNYLPFELKYLATVLSILILKKEQFLYFKPIRDRGFLDQLN